MCIRDSLRGEARPRAGLVERRQQRLVLQQVRVAPIARERARSSATWKTRKNSSRLKSFSERMSRPAKLRITGTFLWVQRTRFTTLRRLAPQDQLPAQGALDPRRPAERVGSRGD